ncbi:MAG: Asp-tRNA(Asn)/Glu-tRNA(Gln) amidotransferase subunit GatC [Gammaproteobacteria bacterium]|nr:Asp-tRNA(Asn)/Glu-tRNA(Gln) amidotransferase subunit GatC [Gammaproteobacteria bacterium]
MSLSEQQVKEIAYLARLSIDDGEVEQTTAELNNILGLMADLAKIDTQGVSPMAHPLNMSQRLRKDEVSETDQSEAFQAIAPQTGQSHFLVPTVIE